MTGLKWEHYYKVSNFGLRGFWGVKRYRITVWIPAAVLAEAQICTIDRRAIQWVTLPQFSGCQASCRREVR